MKVKPLVENLILPKSSYPGDAGIDVYYPYSNISIAPHTRQQLKLGFAIEIEQDEVIITSERSGHAIKHGLTSIGNVIDSNYRGEVSIIVFNSGKDTIEINTGDKIGQFLIMKLGNRNIEIVDELSNTSRGTNAHFSSKND